MGQLRLCWTFKFESIILNTYFSFQPLQQSSALFWILVIKGSSIYFSDSNLLFRRIVVFQHIPWFLKQHDEADHSYFSLKRSLRDVWLPKLEKAGVEAIFCGHYHQNTGGLYNNMPVVVTSAIGGQLGEDKSGARIVKVFPDRIEHQYHPIQELPLRNVWRLIGELCGMLERPFEVQWTA